MIAETLTPGRLLEPVLVPEGAEAADYDALVSQHFWLLQRPFVQVLSRLGLQQARVLDIGAGPGWLPIELARQNPGWEIWALDPSTDMRRRAARHVPAAGLSDRVHLVAGDAAAVPFADGSFDLVISHFVLHHLPAPRRLFDEAARVQAPGGQVVLKDLVRQSGWSAGLRLAFEKWVLGSNAAQLAMSRDSIAAALTLAEVRAELAASRLADARVRRCWGPYYLITSP